LTVNLYSTQLWQLVKTWELTQEFGLEERGRKLYGAGGDARGWLNTIPAETAPASVEIPDGPNGMGGSALVNEYFNNAWYGLQIVLNDGNHQHQKRLPVDWIYVTGRFLDLQRESHRPEPGRALVSVIKSMQSTDPKIGPEDYDQGWRPNQTIGPTIMVTPQWAGVFAPLSPPVRQALTGAMLEAWLEKNTEYPPAQYFSRGRVEPRYKTPETLGAITGEKVWAAAPQFAAAGVRPWLIRNLMDWGNQYTETASRFSY
jgi:hypothetical protein